MIRCCIWICLLWHFTVNTGNIWPQSSLLTEPLWTDPGLKSGICVCKLISTSRTHTHTNAQEGLNGWTLPKVLGSKEKAVVTVIWALKIKKWTIVTSTCIQCASLLQRQSLTILSVCLGPLLGYHRCRNYNTLFSAENLELWKVLSSGWEWVRI